jgi:signal peptidase I
MPDQVRCFRCGTVLIADGGVAIIPPRMARWKRPFRRASRVLRSSFGQLDPKVEQAVSSAGGIFVDIALGLIPGLPFVITGRFGKLWLVLVWLVLAVVGVWSYGHPISMWCIGLAAAVHAWLIITSRIWPLLKTYVDRLAVVLVTAGALTGMYLCLPRLFIPGFALIRSPIEVPVLQVHEGDVLIATRLAMPPVRGMLVTVRASRFAVPYGHGLARSGPGGIALGQVIGLPGEVVEVRADGFYINGSQLDSKLYPVPTWLAGRQAMVRLDQDEYFVAMQYRIAGQLPNDTRLPGNACRVKAEQIVGQVALRWWPLARRGRIRLEQWTGSLG